VVEVVGVWESGGDGLKSGRRGGVLVGGKRDISFEKVKLSYLGGHWVLLEMDSSTSKEKIFNHVGVGSWFEVLKPACNSFVCDERLVWVSIEGLPVKALTLNTFIKIISSWGKLVDIDEYENCSLLCIRVCVKTKPHIFINDRVKIIIKGQLHWICVKEREAWIPEFNNETEDDTSSEEESKGNNDNDLGSHNEHVSETNFTKEKDEEFHNIPNPSGKPVNSKDPFEIYKILKRHKDVLGTEGDTSQHPPCFTLKPIEGLKA
nr:RNA-directed DNA polymerase, eukaryota, nucleotide-binding alpha-beta plait domain protein [Tanacetum cinerariifolium]